MFIGLNLAITGQRFIESGYDPSWMVMTVKTDNAGTSGSDQFTLPLSNYTTNFILALPDGTETTITTYNSLDLTSTFSDGAGTYDIIIKPAAGQDKPIFGGIYFNGGGDRLKLIEIKQWGTAQWKSLFRAFNGCNNMDSSAPDMLDLSAISNLSYNQAFRDCSVLTRIGTGTMSFTGVTDTFGMFLNCRVFSQNFTGSDWSSIQNAGQMFNHCRVFNGLMPTNMNACTDFTSMHQNNWCLNNVTVANRTTAAGVNFSNCLRSCFSLNQSLAGWDVSNATNMTGFNQGSRMDRDNYGDTLIAWAANPPASAVTITMTYSKYESGGAAATARASLVLGGNTIVDAGVYDRATGGAAVADMPSEVDVVLLHGQSNSYGSSGLTGYLESPDPATTVGAQYNSSTGLVACDDPVGVTEGDFDKAYTGSLAPSFVAEYAAQTGRYPVILVMGVPATNADQWCNPDIGMNGAEYINQVYENHLAMLTALADAGKTVGRSIFLWNQGEHDALAIDGGDDPDVRMADWKESMTMIYRIINSRCGGGVKIGVIQTGTECDIATNTRQKVAAYEAVQQGQAEFVAENSWAYMASTFQTTTCEAGLMKDFVHHNQTALNQVGVDSARAAATAYA